MIGENYSAYIDRMNFVNGSPVSIILWKMSQCFSDEEREKLFNNKSMPSNGLTWAVPKNLDEAYVREAVIQHFEKKWRKEAEEKNKQNES